jgi:hypothetical protein
MDTPRDVIEYDLIYRDTARVEGNEAGDGAEERRLTGAVRTEDCDDLAGRGIDGHLKVERADTDGDVRSQHQKALR